MKARSDGKDTPTEGDAPKALLADGRLKQLGRVAPPCSVPRAFGVDNPGVMISHKMLARMRPL